MNKKILPLIFFSVLVPTLSQADGLLKYNPPKTGAPLTLTGGGTRGFGLKPLQVLAPRHIALTSQSQPVLYWYSSLPKQQQVQISLFKVGVDVPIFQKQLDTKPEAGLQSLALAEAGVTLQAGEEYRWSVAIHDTEQGSGDAISSETAAILRYQVPETPLTSVEQQAEAGYWYDAIQQLIQAHSPRANELLEQVGLKIPAL